MPHPVIFNCRSDRFELVRESRLRFSCLGALTIESRGSPAKSGPVHLASAKTFPLYFAHLEGFGTKVAKMFFFSWYMIYFCFATGAISLMPFFEGRIISKLEEIIKILSQQGFSLPFVEK